MDINLINQRLRDQFGSDVSSDKPIYRIVWSSDELEYRTGLFCDYSPGTNILIRSVYETRLVKKYNYINPPEYILECLMPNQHDEIKAKLSYEPIWTFGEQHDIVWRALELLIYTIRNPHKPFTDEQLATMENEELIKDAELIDKMLQENMRFDTFHSSVQDGDSIILDKTDYWSKKKNENLS